MGDGGAGEEPKSPGPGDAAGGPIGTDWPAALEAVADGPPLAGDGGPDAGAVGDTVPQATATTDRTARSAARRSGRSGWTVTAEGGYRDWPEPAALLGFCPGPLPGALAGGLRGSARAGYPRGVTRPHVPQEVLDLAHARREARIARDWARADALRADIESAGWTVVDRGVDFDLAPAHPPDLVADGIVRHGSSESVPSRLAEPATAPATVIVTATDWPADVARAVRGLASDEPAGTQVVVVADGPSPGQDEEVEALEASGAETVRTSDRLGQAAAFNAGVRRAVGAVVVLLDPSVEPTGDVIGPLVRALGDPTVGVAGPWGMRSTDLRHFEDAPGPDADAIAGYCLAFRRADFTDRGPFDEKFRFYRNLDIWWSLVLRDEGEGRPPRRAVVVPDLPAVRHEHRAWTSLSQDERDRLSRRNFYRVLHRFGARLDLASSAGAAGRS
jgi:GT2 family glycosyltransferase